MKILLALDGSECSQTALQHILDDKTIPENSHLKVISVAEFIINTCAMSGYYDSSLQDAEEALKDERATTVAKAIARLKQRFPLATIDGHSPFGQPAEQILAFAKEWAADLIVLGTHDRKGLAHLFMGSVAEKVVKAAPCSVEVVRKPVTEMSK